MSNDINTNVTTDDLVTSDIPRKEFFEQVAQEKRKQPVRGKTLGQRAYLDAINTSIIVACTGCAGTGKTYLAVVRALELLEEGLFKRIIIARPNVPCGEDLGHLPGEISEKIAPYMLPIVDILEERLGDKKAKEYMSHSIIQLCPLAYMRGRSLKEAIMILDEAQNAKWEQIVMFLTRIDENSKIIISGDEDQKDIQGDAYRQAIDKLERSPYIDAVQVVRLTEDDIVRHPIIRKLLRKLGRYQPMYRYKDE